MARRDGGTFLARKGKTMRRSVGEILFAIKDRAPRVPRMHFKGLTTTKRGFTKTTKTMNPKDRVAQERANRIRAGVQREFNQAWKRGEI